MASIAPISEICLVSEIFDDKIFSYVSGVVVKEAKKAGGSI